MVKKPKIIATGLSGLVGSRIKELLPQYNWVDFSLDVGIDILDKIKLSEAFEENKDARAVLHLAAFTDTNKAWQEKGDKSGLCYRLNVEGTKNIIDFCQKYGFYLIYISTDFVFDGKKDDVYTEEDKPNPIEWYGQTKYWAEKEVLKSEVVAAIVRIAFPFRAEFSGKADIVRKILAGLESDNLFPMFADQIITPTFIDDIAEGMGMFIEKKPTGIYHLVGSNHISPFQLSREIAQAFDFDPEKIKKGNLVKYQTSLSKDARPWQKNLALSNQKVANLGIKMSSLREALLKLRQQLLSQ